MKTRFPNRRVTAPLLGLLGLLAVAPAWAHGSIPGGSAFFAGLVHPALVAAHLVGLIAVALMAAQQGLSPRPHELLGLAAGLALGALAAGWAGEPDTDRALWLLVVATALAVAFGRNYPAAFRLWMPACIGLAMGLASGDATLTGGRRVAALAGSFIGAMVIASQLAVAIEALLRRWPHPALRIGVRVLASWVAAVGVLLTALALRPAG
ncbi:HupE/UreJ family protein [Leptothrix discophora]|uniref:HupE/UreJ family protein n=1 Tax=Leptothrix discophora TaxID=89 RepID=A0ABT9G3M7_LEPDI|nr:HupE/UreJ family protein [Leptothrix discophora]MDP4301093.1 HupE/UreJ family protein [Leptothrix discophora]